MKKILELRNKNKNISHVEFGLFSNSEIIQQSHVHVYKNNIYDDQKIPVSNGLMDAKMGPLDESKCQVCDQTKKNCMGHYGNLNMSNFIYPISYLRDIVKILKCICKDCGRILLNLKQMQHYSKVLKKKEMNYVAKKSIRKEIMTITMKVKVCSFCSSSNGSVKKVKALSMIVFRKFDRKENLARYGDRFLHLPDDQRKMAQEGIIILRPYEVYELFKRVPVMHYKYLGLGTKMKMSDLIFKHLTVPPNCIRPSTDTNDANTNREDDLTICLRTLLGDLKLPVAHNEYTSMIKPGAANLRVKDTKFIRGILQRLAGKKGRFRNNLMGKRTNFTGRTVISPDPYLRIDQVSIPQYCALKLTFTEKVTDFNIDYLRKLILNGPNCHPGATAHARMFDNDPSEAMSHMKMINSNISWISLRFEKHRKSSAETLKVGDLVERHISDGDLVLFNRQPSLHRLSFQSFSVVVKKERTLSFNPCCCSPFNADFDGDEMNIHFPQTYEAKAECLTLISSLKNISSPNRGEPLTSPLQDILTAAYLLTSKDSFYTESQFFHLALRIFPELDMNKRICLPKPVILRPMKLYTGKQLISLVISPYKINNMPEARVNLRTENKVYRTGEDLVADDSWVVIHNSELMMGQLDKALLGGGSKQSLFYRLLRDVSDEASCRSMERLCKIALTDLKYKGFSIGISDVCPSSRLKQTKQNLINKNFLDCEELIKSYENKTLDCDPGCSIEETLESKISSKLSNIRDDGGKACKDDLPRRNAPLIMALCGSKGSNINISQMIFCVGQQIIGNKRIPNVSGTDRTLLFSPKNCRSPMSKGFVANSFYSGLTPPEFMFHAMSGREGLIDTAVKTAETGYMQRRLVKALEDLTIQFDNTVRDFRGYLYQNKYGCDGYDPSKLETTTSPCNFVHELYHALQDIRSNDAPLLDINIALLELERLLSVKEDSFVGLKDLLRENVRLHFSCNVGLKFGASTRQLGIFVDNCYSKYRRAIIEPGTAVGVICGQSIGEPATQMTLKTFHFAGVASMNITQGVPRMQEIINASENIKTPIITIYPMDESSELDAKRIQKLIQPVFMRDLIYKSDVVYTTRGIFFEIDLQLDLIKKLDISHSMLLEALDKAKVKDISIDVIYKDNRRVCIRVFAEQSFNFQTVLKVLEKIQVLGLKNVKRTVIQRNDDNKHTVYMEGGDLLEALQIPGINTVKTHSNNIIEIMRVLGVEAAKNGIINEFNAVMAAHSLATDLRHVMLLADIMCYTGQVLGYQRSGMAKSKNSVLCLASFENTLDHLFEAAYHNQKDEINGVSDCITFGKTIPIGTGMSTILWNPVPQDKKKVCRKRKFLDC